MRSFVYLILFMIISCSVFASESNTLSENLDFYLSNTPSEKGNNTFAYIRWFYDENTSSSFYFIHDKRTEESNIIGRTDSLLVSKSRDIIFDMFPYEYTVALGGSLLMRGGIGLSIVKSALEEKGYFITSPSNPFHPSVPETATTNHVFNNASDITFYTGKFQIELKIKTFDDNFSIRNLTEYIPFYYLHHSQKMNISPLISNSPCSHDYSGASSPYLMNEIRIHVFKILEFQYQIEYQKLKFEQIGINYYTGSWVFVVSDENTYTICNYSFACNIRPDVFKEVDPLIGFGKKWFRTKNTTTGESLVRENEWIFNSGFTSRKF